MSAMRALSRAARASRGRPAGTRASRARRSRRLCVRSGARRLPCAATLARAADVSDPRPCNERVFQGAKALPSTAVTTDVVTMDKIVALCKRRGLIFPASEIYGGIANTYDYGHYGVLLKNNVTAAWWRAMIQERDDIVALDSAIIQHPRTWEASGHLAGFSDPLIECRTCNLRFRADHLQEARDGIAEHPDIRCGHAPSKLPGDPPDCDLTEAREFNLMFETQIGPVKEAGSTVYLRPETAQGIFLDFKTTLQYARKKPPFGIAQIGKSFRNEITPGNFIFR